MKNTLLRKILCAAMSAMMLLSLTACGDKQTDNQGDSKDENAGGKTYTVGICNYVDDASLNQIAENIQSQLKVLAEENGVTINVNYDNPNADAAVMNQIIANFIADKSDVIVGIATPVAMANRGQQDSGCVLGCFRPRKRGIG